MSKQIYIFSVWGFMFIIGLGLLAGGYYINIQKKSHIQTLCFGTGGEYIDDTCVCSDLYPLYSTDDNTCKNIDGISPLSRDEFEKITERYSFAEKCNRSQKEIYVIPGTPLNMCYTRGSAAAKVVYDTSDAHIVDLLDDGTTRARLAYIRYPLLDSNVLACNDPMCDTFVTLADVVESQEYVQNNMAFVTSSFHDVYELETDYVLPFVDDAHHVVITSCSDDEFCQRLAEHTWIDGLLK